MVIAIVIAEITFWVLIALGLVARYALGRKRLGFALLAATPLVDVALLSFVAVDLAGGGVATTAHALSAVYLGVSVVFGRSMIDWADVRAAHWFAGGPKPVKPSGAAKARRDRDGVLKHAAAWAIGVALLLLATVVVGDAQRTEAFTATAKLWTVVLVIDALVSWPGRSQAGDSRRAPSPARREPVER